VLGTRTIVHCVHACFCAIFIFAMVAPYIADAAEHPPLADPVDAALDRCLSASTTKTTLDIRSCYQRAEHAYDGLLAKAYQNALHHVDPASQALIRASQESWLAYRRREIRAQRGPWINDRGTVVSIEVDEANLAAVHARLVDLYLFWPGFAGPG